MIIWVQGQLSDFSAPLSQVLIDALTDLGDAGYAGRHVVLASRPLLKRFAEEGSLSVRARSYYARVAEEYTQLGHVLSYSFHLLASVDAVAPVKYGGVWTVPLSFFATSNYSEAATVVCENDTDYEVIQALAEVFVRREVPGCVLTSRSHAGGGGGTATVLARLLRDPNPIILCVLDSDREVVLGAEGSTARGARGVWIDSWRSTLYVLTSRELENVLPHDLVVKCARDARMDTRLIELYEDVPKDVSAYACLKSGESLCRFYEITAAHAGYARTRAALTDLAARHPSFSNCGRECGDCDCTVVPQLGRAFLERFSQWVREHSNWRSLVSSDHWSDDLLEVVKLFTGVSLALPRKL